MSGRICNPLDRLINYDQLLKPKQNTQPLMPNAGPQRIVTLTETKASAFRLPVGLKLCHLHPSEKLVDKWISTVYPNLPYILIVCSTLFSHHLYHEPKIVNVRARHGFKQSLLPVIGTVHTAQEKAQLSILASSRHAAACCLKATKPSLVGLKHDSFA